MKTLYFDCSSGISGDMAVAALLDLGGDRQALVEGLESLQLEGYRLEFSRVNKNGIDAFDFCVHLEEEDHMSLYPREDAPCLPEGEDGRHRTFAQIRDLILDSGITPWAKEKALKIFQVVAQAEAKVHAVPVDQVQFHEVGAVDSIVDIVGVAILMDHLGIERIVCSPLTEGTGRVKCRHGWLPVPAPATLEIVRSHGIPLRQISQEGELVTPTGAAIVAALADKIGTPQHYTVSGVGYGAGKRNYPHTPGVLRILAINELSGPEEAGDDETVCEISCNLDDIASESLAYACEELLRQGALDVWVTPATVKKDRPGHLLSLLCEAPREAEFARLLLRHTSATGVRSCLKKRTVMASRQFSVPTPYGPVLVRESSLDGMRKVKVEFESAREIAREKGLPIHHVLSAAHAALARRYEGKDAL